MADNPSYSSIPTATAVPVGPPVVQLVAPSTMEAGYTFHATYNGVVFPVRVPEGGVKKGETFTVPFGHDSMGESSPLFLADANAPPGRWKDGLCDCCRFGPCHVSLWNAICCPQILMAQVLTRLKMTWLGATAEDQEWRMTFRRILVLVVAYWLVSSFLAPDVSSDDIDIEEATGTVTFEQEDAPFWQRFLYNLVSTAFGLYTLIVMIRLRWAVRDRYGIPVATVCGSAEDCCCVFFCGCCTVAQLARHTADYEQKRALCCSDTGLPPSTPIIIV